MAPECSSPYSQLSVICPYPEPTGSSHYPHIPLTEDSSLYRGELSYLAPLGNENISAPYFKHCFFQGGYYPQTVKHHASQSQDRNNKYFILYIEFCIKNKF